MYNKYYVTVILNPGTAHTEKYVHIFLKQEVIEKLTLTDNSMIFWYYICEMGFNNWKTTLLRK